jgi:MFS family permease
VTATPRSDVVATPTSVWSPLRIRAYRVLWLAQLGSMLGTWMQTVGAQRLLVETPDSAALVALVALVALAAMVPILLFALPAGALADIMDRRRLLIGVQLFPDDRGWCAEHSERAGSDAARRCCSPSPSCSAPA